MPKKNVQKMDNKLLMMITKEKNDFDDHIWKKSKDFDNNKGDATQRIMSKKNAPNMNWKTCMIKKSKEINATTMHLA
jgi:hypothetical protein